MSQDKPPFEVPPGAVAKVSIIDSTVRLRKMSPSYLCKPPIEGWDEFPAAPTWSFLIESPSGKKALFDLGLHLDLTRYVPRTQDNIKKNGWKSEAKENVADIIRRHGVSPKEIDSIIWSHFHYDHIGDPTTFPSSTELVVGPGFKEAVLPGYPTKPDAPVTEQDLSGRDIREIDFTRDHLEVGPFPAIDFFGDGSFYLLDTPGHCTGHIAGLARTSKAGQGTDADTFIMMGGDLCHHGSVIRPSPYLPLPDPLPSSIRALISRKAIQELNARRGRKPEGPLTQPAICIDEEASDETLRRAQIADADPDIWFIFAHDTALFEGVDLFPKAANAWKANGWKEKTMWKFLEDFVSVINGR